MSTTSSSADATGSASRLPPSTAPDSFVVRCRGFADEHSAQAIGSTVGEFVRLLGSRFDLSGLDGVTVAFDYDEALLELDRGYDTDFKLMRAQGHAVGIAMTPSVLRDGVLKSHIVLNAGYTAGIVMPEDESFQLAVHQIAHECAHVEITHKFDTCFPGRLLRYTATDIWEQLRGNVIGAVWDEFAATNFSAGIGEDPTEGYEQTFVSVLTEARGRANRAILAYRTHGDVDRVVSEVYGTYGALIKYAAYHLGNLHGKGVPWKDRTKTVEALTSHWFAPYFDRLEEACLKIGERYGKWSSLAEFDPIADLADEVVAEGGLYFTREREGHVRVHVPFARDTMPDDWDPGLA